MAELSVLLVEDSGFMAEHVSETLESEYGMELRVAENAETARSLLDAGAFDCLVVNVRLPDENGVGFVETIGTGGSPPLPVVLFTGDSLEAVAERAFAAGVVDVVSKEHHAGESMAVFANRIETAVDAYRHRHAGE